LEDLRDEEEKQLAHVYEKGCSLINMQMPVGYEKQFPLI